MKHFLVWARSHVIAVCVILALLGTWVGLPFVLSAVYPDLEQRGQFGDSYGTINALFSGLALTLVAWSVFLQRRDLQATLQELQRSAQAQEESKSVLESQVRATREQSQATLHLTKTLGLSAQLLREGQMAEYFRGTEVSAPAKEARRIQQEISAVLNEVDASGVSLSDPSTLGPRNPEDRDL